MIDIYSVEYLNIRTGDREWANVYAYPSGGVGMSVSDPELVKTMGGVRVLVEGVSPTEADLLAQRLADIVAYLTDGEITHSDIDTADEE